MRKYLLGILLLAGLIATAQTKKTRLSLAGSRLLVKTIFETKDSATLESLFATGMRHMTANGTIETREESIRNISGNRSSYKQAEMLPGYGVAPAKDSTIVRYFYKGTETRPDGQSSPFTVNLTMVWEKQKKKMKLTRLETKRVD